MKQIIQNLQLKFKLSSNEKLAQFLNVATATILRSQSSKIKVGLGLTTAWTLISFLIDEMSSEQLKKAMDKFKKKDWS